MATILAAELTFLDGEFRPDVWVSIGDDGRVASTRSGAADKPTDAAITALPGRALLPGLINAHSHAFQRLLRGRTEWRSIGGDDFWAWRERMYDVAGRLTPDQLEDVSAFAFLEMARAGITAVGEFHYLHRDPAGAAYADPSELSWRVIRAAERVGLRIVLLRGAYARGGQHQALAGAQLRFGLKSIEQFVADGEALEQALRGHALATVGAAAHSVRALSPGQLRELGQAVASKPWPLHMHLSEQPREVDGCLAETGRRPVELAAECGLISPRFCAVHAIHVKPSEMALLGRAGAAVCACPTTERDLADGVVPAAALRLAGVGLALGSDSQVQIDLLEEARSLEQNLRLLQRERVLLDPTEDQRSALAHTLFEAATSGGAKALGLGAQAIRSGLSADLFTVDLADPSVAARPEELLATLVFGGQTRAIRDVLVNGRFLIRDGEHPEAAAIGERYRAVLRSL